MTPDPDASRDGAERRRKRPREAGTRALLDSLAIGNPDDLLKLGDILSGLGRRAFAVLLFLAIPPSFIPGVAGVISSPIVILVGVQLLWGLRRPWLPRFLAERGPHRKIIIRFDEVFSPWLKRLEHLIKPRYTGVLDHRAASMLTGLILILLGVLLALPIPLTNPIFGGLLLLFALALLERDGLLMLLSWLASAIAIAIFGVLSGSLAATAAHWIGKVI